MSAFLSLPMGGGSINVEHFTATEVGYLKAYTFNFQKAKNTTKCFYLIESKNGAYVEKFTNTQIVVMSQGNGNIINVQVVEFI